MNIYTLRAGFAWKNDPDTIGRTLESIKDENGGYLKPEHVVNAARRSDHVLHREFEWNNKAAGEMWRRQQARVLIKSVIVEVIDPGEAVVKHPQFLNVQLPEEKKVKDNQAYISVNDSFTDVEKRRYVLEKLRTEIKRIENNYVFMRELNDYIKDLDAIVLRIDQELLILN